jgi:hypothetical protein
VFPSLLEMRISLGYFAPWIRDDLGSEWFLTLRYWEDSFDHTTLPDPRPVITTPESPHDTIGRVFGPGDPLRSEKPPHLDISLIGDTIACLLVRVDMLHPIPLEKYPHHFWEITFEYDEWYTDTSEWCLEIDEWLFDELSMKWWKIRGSCHSWFEIIERTYRYPLSSPELESLSEGLMIRDSEITLVPNEDEWRK